MNVELVVFYVGLKCIVIETPILFLIVTFGPICNIIRTYLNTIHKWGNHV
ncbi:hypothetical protein SAMN05421659_101491 [[Clostridium] fimetarium]|uniref:Uncharacterized protein n=1 Tax=[Clostridium] fimetarium TaxID=99656 RepID=A0A1I0MG61_9FIRM|nr:hypothetical protein SAMN05421659_101491 [[Clostridium] fimetarium]